MINPLKNELEIELGAEKLLLRPSFENLAALEAQIGPLDSLSFSLSRQTEDKPRLLSITESVRIIFHCQEPKNLSISEIHSLVMSAGIKARSQLYKFLLTITAGDDAAAEISEEQKKN
jgi:hypothetical protein